MRMASDRGRPVRPRLVPLRSVCLVAALCTLVVVTAAPAPALGADRPGAPGVTPTAISTGAISTLSGPLAGDFDALVPGVKAYFDMVNAAGGIDGRKLVLSANEDDGGSPSEFTALARTLVDQDHVFAVVGVSSPWFSPGFFAQAKVPTYGYNVSGNWAGPPNLFSPNGSVQCYSCFTPGYAYLIKRLGATSVAFLAYNVSSSRKACATPASLLARAGVKVSFEDLNVPIDGAITPDVQRIARAGSDLVLSCMDVTENIALARAVKQYGLHLAQIWLNGGDQTVINQYSSLIQHVYFLLQSVPLTAPRAEYPGLGAYLSAMGRYEPRYVGDSLAVQGWAAAALFAAGVRAAGSDLTQQRVIEATNRMKSFSGGGMTIVTDWTKSHTENTSPDCAAFTRVEGRRLVSVFTQHHQVFTCFPAGAVKHPVPVAAPPGTPGA